MSEFIVEVVEINEVYDHPDADRLSIIKIKGFLLISNKVNGAHRYKAGDLVVYIPEASIVPAEILKEINMWDFEKNKGLLAGSKGDRVKAKNLRGIISQGIIYPTLTGAKMIPAELGFDAGEILGITKYEPVIPASMNGSCVMSPYVLKFDFENIQKVNDLFEIGMPVIATEKLHGTACKIGFMYNEKPDFGFDHMWVTSKGLGNKGITFKNDPENDKNLYVRMLKKYMAQGLQDRMFEIARQSGGQKIQIGGEIIGLGVQDLTYGMKEVDFFLYYVRIDGYHMDAIDLPEFGFQLALRVVPELYRGPFIEDDLKKVRDGLDFSGSHIREGIVIRSQYEDPFKRYIAKWISPDYLTRKNGTEFT